MRLGLLAAGVQRGDYIGLHMGRSVDLVATILAAWEIGATYVPLDKALPSERINLLLADTGANLVISDHSEGLGPVSAAHALSPKAIRTLSTATERVPPERVDSDSSVAYVMYTSGSTGRPKGVCTTHANLKAFLASWCAVVNPNSPGTWLAATTISFDPSIVELIWTLANGATVVLAPSYGESNSLGALITDYTVTHFQCTPSRAKVLLRDPLERKAISQLEHLLIGGEILSAGLANQLHQTGLKRLTNVYGPTETTVWAFAHDVAPGATDPIPIGIALPGIAYEVSSLSNAIHDIEVGELIIGGLSVGSYLHDRPSGSPFSENGAPRTRWYRTGDTVGVDAQGALTFHGRTDNQVKVNGVRIELAEIETALETQPDVREAVAAVIKPPSGDDYLIAWVVPGKLEPERSDFTDLRERMKYVLPRGFVPRNIIELPAFPLTSTGKADRKRLHDEHLPIVGAASDPASSPDYLVGAAVTDFARALNISIVTENTNFFEAGGDSLAALELVTMVHESTGINLPLRCLLEAPTPRLFANYVADCQPIDQPTDGPATADAVLVRFGASRAKRRFYIVHGDGGNVIGFRTLAMQLSETFDVVGIEAIGVEPGFEPDQTFSAMVNRYATAIRSDRVEGSPAPLFLGGYSGGGKTAVAIAAILQGEMTVAPVALFDAAVFENLRPSRMARLRAILAAARDRGPQTLGRWADTSFRVWNTRFDTDPNPELPFAQVEFAIAQATAPRPKTQLLANGAFLIRVLQRNPVFEVDFNWANVVKRHVPTYWVDGQHLAMFLSPTVDQVADKVRQAFASYL
jgi:amino acid adenylation domain-containing protein